ncbi:unnamed protein product [Rotaria sordida]|uniref:Uncharacterized protein n=1 Tax=Rotaria sordida TaxID=392033 RepID=A0A819MIA3_9BILA|nr:unnamed protein product [Rotaria sordida]CAF4002895.1 unnamed protein product [Rotaria sordida]
MNLSINDNDKMILDDYSSSAEKNYQQKDGNSKEENGDIDLIEERRIDENIDEKHLQSLKTKFFLYESDGI